jgi:molybdopterin synthase sulfur carrier subunit
MTVLYFAHARRITGISQEEIPVTTSLSFSDFWELIIAKHPPLATLRVNSRLARNDDFLSASARVEPTDEIAIIPPVSGG